MFKVSFWNGIETEVYSFYTKESFARIACIELIRKGFNPTIEEVSEEEVDMYYMSLLESMLDD